MFSLRQRCKHKVIGAYKDTDDMQQLYTRGLHWDRNRTHLRRTRTSIPSPPVSAKMCFHPHCVPACTSSGVSRILLQDGGTRARGARVPKFVLTKSSRSENHLSLGLQNLRAFANSRGARAPVTHVWRRHCVHRPTDGLIAVRKKLENV